MKKTKTTYEQAAAQYNEFFGEIPAINEMDDLYHKYSCDWKHYNDFADWLLNNVA